MSDNLSKSEEARQIQHGSKYSFCPLCWNPLFPAWQFGCCGERICLHCVQQYRNRRPLECPSLTCRTENPQIRADKGSDNDHQHKQINCDECSWRGSFAELRDHILVHCNWICDACGEAFIAKAPLDTHKQLLCPLRYVTCPLSSHGCVKEVRYADLETHSLTSEHQRVLTDVVRKLLIRISDMTQAINGKAEKDKKRTALLSTLLNGIATFQDQLKKISDGKTVIQERQQSIKIQIMKLREELQNVREAFADEKLFKECLKICEDLRRLMNDYQPSPLNTLCSVLGYDDTFTLKIDLILLLSENSGTIDSQLFQSSNWGYRMKISAGTNRMVSNSKQHMAVSFSLIPGLYDDILSWPFRFPFTFRLVDLTGSGQHITKDISPDPNQACFFKPDHKTNEKYCVDQFCPIEKLTVENSHYVQDNSMCLQLHMHYLQIDESSAFNMCTNT